jgi:hypothetical protein
VIIGPVGWLILLLLVAAPVVALVRTRVTAHGLAWIAGGATPAPDEAAVYTRYLRRHRVHRLAGGLFGVAFAVVVSIRLYGSVLMGIGQNGPLGDVLFCGLVGVLIGALSAESFRLSEPRTSRAAASLAPRGIPSQARLVTVARAMAVGSLLLGAVVAATGNGWTSLAVAVGGLAVLAVAEATRAAIAGRRRPVLSDRAHVVDAAIRRYAAGSVAHLELAAAVLVASWTLSKVPGLEGSLLGVVRMLVVITALVATVVLLRRAAPRPPRGWVPASP